MSNLIVAKNSLWMGGKLSYEETSNEITTTVYLKDGKPDQVKLAELDNYLKVNQEKIEPRKFNARRSQIKKTAC